MLPPLTHTADARTAGWRKVPRRILPRTSSVWRQPRRPRSRPPIPQRRMNVEASGGTRFHPRPRFFMPRAWLLFCAERHVTGYPVRPLREWIRARVEPRPPGFLARRSTRSVLDCGREAERSHRFGRGARTGEAQRRSPPCPAGESGGKPHALQDLAKSAHGLLRRHFYTQPRYMADAAPRRSSPLANPAWFPPHRRAAEFRLAIETVGGDAVPPAPQILHAARLLPFQRRASRHGIARTTSSRIDQGAGGTAPSHVLGAPVRAKRLGLRWRSRAEPPLWAGCPDRRGATTFVATSGRRKRWQATRTPRPRGVRMGREKSRWRRGAPRRLFFASRQRVSVRIGPHRYAAPIRLRCRRTLGPP